MFSRKLQTDYASTLREYLARTGENSLQHAYELGRQAIQNGMGVMDIVSIHNEELFKLLSGASTAKECMQIADAAQNLFIECLAPFELTHRGFKDIESVNRDLESFSYSISHDLRAPLRAIDGFSKMLAKDLENEADEERKRKLDIVRNNVQKMDRLIEGLLTFSRAGRSAISPVRLDIKRIVKEIWDEQCLLNPGRRMELRIGRLPLSSGDRILIRQVVANLLANAVKYTRKKKSATIKIGGHAQDGENVYNIKDNGAGFDMTYYDKLFGVFQRLHSESEYEGTGVGLAIVQRIIHRHGGRVWAEGKVGQGAIFYFSLPADQSVRKQSIQKSPETGHA